MGVYSNKGITIVSLLFILADPRTDNLWSVIITYRVGVAMKFEITSPVSINICKFSKCIRPPARDFEFSNAARLLFLYCHWNS